MKSIRNKSPIILREPSAQQILANGKISLRIVAEGSPLYYQWFLNGLPIPGANSDKYLLSKASIDYAGDYSCEVSNLSDKVMSRTVSVRVITENIGPLELLPVAANPTQGEFFCFAVFSQSGNISDLEFQWFCNGKKIPGAHNATLEISHVTKQNEGQYKAVLLLGTEVLSTNVATLTMEQAEQLPTTSFTQKNDFFFNPEDFLDPEPENNPRRQLLLKKKAALERMLGLFQEHKSARKEAA